MNDPTSLLNASPEGLAACPFHSDKFANASTETRTKKMVLTGASRGIGHATVRLFSEAGWRVITCSRQPFNRDRCPWSAGADDHVQGHGDLLVERIGRSDPETRAVLSNCRMRPRRRKVKSSALVC